MWMVGKRVRGKRSGRFGEFVDSLLVEVRILNKLCMLDMCIRNLECIVFIGRSTGMACVWLVRVYMKCNYFARLRPYRF